MPEERRERDLILAPNEHAFILDETKGNVVNYVGPHKTSLANTDQPVVFNNQTKRFDRCNLEKAIKAYTISPEGWYVVLKNPAKDGRPPTSGTANSLPELSIGRKVNIPGPVAFAPWPGQMVRVIQGHNLRSDQYLIVRVYDEEAARTNWKKAVIKPQTLFAGETSEASGEEEGVKPDRDIPDLTMGKLLVIKGTDVSFYIPPTGIEVVSDPDGKYARKAVTLERLEYCVLLNEDGNKRYIRGPAVVFPKPTETFTEKNGARKFKAIELNEISGLYIKVIAAYTENGREYKVGEELFITGKEQMIYFPRPEHAIVRYGEQELTYSVAIPAGEARYVLNRMTGQITLKKGPCMFLADPRKEVIARRVLDPRLVELWFPGNQEALEYNRRLMDITDKEKTGKVVMDQQVQNLLKRKAQITEADAQEPVSQEISGDKFTRHQTFSRPRTVTLDTKYEGAVAINVWTGYAVMVVSKTGNRKVIVGPQTCLLEYDEILETVELSTGTPKTEDKLIKTVYLRVLHNKVSDVIEAETRDLCQVRIYVSYRVNFEGEPEKWFNVENYVKFLSDHIRSMLRHAVRQYGIEEFYGDAVCIVRDTVLGKSGEDGKRPGALFDENNMRIYDVEVLDIRIGDEEIGGLLIHAQHTAIEQTLDIASEKKRLEVTGQKESVKQDIAKIEADTARMLLGLQEEDVQNRAKLETAKIESETEAQKQRLEAKLTDQHTLEQIHSAELAREKAAYDLKLGVARQQLIHNIEELKAEVEAVVAKAQAVSPQLVAALQNFSDKALAGKMAETMAPLAILGGESIAEVFGRLLKGTALEKVLLGSGAEKGGGKSS
jgi:major vault protein